MMRNRGVFTTAAAILAALLISALGGSTPAFSQAANQLCAAAGVGAGCIGTPTLSAGGGGGGGMGGLGGMGNAMNAFSMGMTFFSLLESMQEASEASAASAPAAHPANLGGYTTYSQPSAPATDTFNLERTSLLDEFRPIGADAGPSAYDPTNPSIGADPGVQAEKTSLMSGMRDLGTTDEAISDNAQAPFDKALPNSGNSAGGQLCSAAGLSSACIDKPKLGGVGPGAPARAVPGQGGGSPSGPSRVASTNSTFVPSSPSAVNPPLGGPSDGITDPPIGSTTDSGPGAPQGGTPIGIDLPVSATGGAPAGVTTGSSGGGGGPGSNRPCNQISGYQLTTGTFGDTDVKAQISPCDSGSANVASGGPSDGIKVDLDKPVPFLRAPTESKSAALTGGVPPSPVFRSGSGSGVGGGAIAAPSPSIANCGGLASPMRRMLSDYYDDTSAWLGDREHRQWLGDAFFIAMLPLTVSAPVEAMGSDAIEAAEEAGLWQNRMPGVQMRRFGDWWAKRVNPDANPLMQWWGQQSIDAQYEGLQALDEMATPNEMRDGTLFTHDVGPTLADGSRFTNSIARNAYFKGSWRMSALFNDIQPRNMGANGLIFDPAIDPVMKLVFWAGLAATTCGVSVFADAGSTSP